MVFKHVYYLIIVAYVVSLLGCSNSNTLLIQELKTKNDSLTSIITDLNQKFIFDSISVRDIPSNKNTYYNNSDVAGEVVVVAYNHDDKMNMILADSITFESNLKLHNPDTLKMIKGSFLYRKKLKDSLSLNGILKIESTYGKDYEALYKTLIKAK